MPLYLNTIKSKHLNKINKFKKNVIVHLVQALHTYSLSYKIKGKKNKRPLILTEYKISSKSAVSFGVLLNLWVYTTVKAGYIHKTCLSKWLAFVQRGL